MSVHRNLIQSAAALAALLIAAACGGGGNDRSAATSASRAAALGAPGSERANPRGEVVVSDYATGLSSPRGLAFGPDGHLYVAEAGSGGTTVATDTLECPKKFNIFSPYSGGHTGRVLRVRADGTRQTVVEGLPSTTDATQVNFGPSDLAFIDETLYVLIEMGGCSHGLPNDDAAILRVNPDGSTTRVANLAAWLAANPPSFIKDTDPNSTDLEPGGVWHSMIAHRGALYVVETNRGTLVRVNPDTGTIERMYDMTVDNAEHNPIVMTQHRGRFYVGTFGEDGGPAELAVFDGRFSAYTLPFKSRNPIVGLAWRRQSLYAVEIFPYDDPWSPASAQLVAFNPATGERKAVATGFATFPNGLIVGPDGALYTSNVGISGSSGDGGVLRIELP
jgi:hypothetical protein